MSFVEYLKVPMVIDLTSTEKVKALDELVRVLCKAIGVRRYRAILDEITKREDSASTYIGHGIALPHAKANIETDFAFVVGRSMLGVPFDAARGAQARIVVLLLTRDEADRSSHLQMLAEIAGFFKQASVRDAILTSETPVNLPAIVADVRQPVVDKQKRPKTKPQDPILASASRLATEIKAKHIIAFADTVADNDFLDQVKGRISVVVVCSNKTRFDPNHRKVHAVINAPAMPSSRFDQMKIGILLALSRNLLTRKDKVVCISGNPKKGVFDTIVVLDIAAEYEFFFTNAQNILPADVKPEVLERVLGLAAEIAIEGREGKPIGTIFVIGDTNTVNGFLRQLIINPFRGYSEGERNILDPGLDETIKEFAAIDGAFVVTGDGIVLSAGSYLRPQVSDLESLPSGLGARHAAAAGITACTNALAVTVSESTGMVSLFKSGIILMTISKPVVQDRGMVQKML